jgi:hypothetical protein
MAIKILILLKNIRECPFTLVDYARIGEARHTEKPVLELRADSLLKRPISLELLPQLLDPSPGSPPYGGAFHGQPVPQNPNYLSSLF